jgi:hypothetical protein
MQLKIKECSREEFISGGRKTTEEENLHKEEEENVP